MYSTLTLEQARIGFVRYKIATGRSANTVSNYKNSLGKLEDYFQTQLNIAEPTISDLTRHNLVSFFAWLQTEHVSLMKGVAKRQPRPLSAKTVINIHTDLSSFWAWMVNEGLAEKNIVRTIETPRYNATVVNPYTKDEIIALLKACNETNAWSSKPETATRRPTSVRDQLIILLLTDTGMRATELCQVRLKDIDMNTNSIDVEGKGRKRRVVQFGKRTSKLLWKHLLPRLQNQETSTEYLILSRHKDDPTPLNRNTLLKLIKRISKRAGVPNAHPHRFRHTFAVNYLRNGGDIFTLQALLGHSTVDMVKRYVRFVKTDIEDAHRRASPVDNWRL